MRGGHGFKVSSYTVNGVTDRTRKWVQVLERATCRRDLRYLTLLPFRYALPDHLFHRYRTWCAVCFEQWRLNGQSVYEPLLWAIKTSSYCPVHLRQLHNVCPCCGRTMSALSVLFRPGYCGHCGSWLAAPDLKTDKSQSGPPTDDERWSWTQVGSLLAMLPVIDPIVARDSLRRSLAIYLGEIANGNVLAFSETFYVPVGCCALVSPARTPPDQNLLRIARCLNVPVSSFFAPEGPTPVDIAAAKHTVAIGRKRLVLPSRHAREIRQTLQTALDAALPVSVTEIARRLGYTTTYSL